MLTRDQVFVYSVKTVFGLVIRRGSEYDAKEEERK